MKSIIQGTLFLATLTLTSPLIAGKCTSHGGPYLNLQECNEAESKIKLKCIEKADESADARKEAVRLDKDLVNKEGQFSRIEIDHERELHECNNAWVIGRHECSKNCPP